MRVASRELTRQVGAHRGHYVCMYELGAQNRRQQPLGRGKARLATWCNSRKKCCSRGNCNNCTCPITKFRIDVNGREGPSCVSRSRKFANYRTCRLPQVGILHNAASTKKGVKSLSGALDPNHCQASVPESVEMRLALLTFLVLLQMHPCNAGLQVLQAPVDALQTCQIFCPLVLTILR